MFKARSPASKADDVPSAPPSNCKTPLRPCDILQLKPIQKLHMLPPKLTTSDTRETFLPASFGMLGSTSRPLEQKSPLMKHMIRPKLSPQSTQSLVREDHRSLNGLKRGFIHHHHKQDNLPQQRRKKKTGKKQKVREAAAAAEESATTTIVGGQSEDQQLQDLWTQFDKREARLRSRPHRRRRLRVDSWLKVFACSAEGVVDDDSDVGDDDDYDHDHDHDGFAIGNAVLGAWEDEEVMMRRGLFREPGNW